MQLHLASLIYLALFEMPQIPVDSACVQSIVKPSDPVSNGITPSDYRPITKAQRTSWLLLIRLFQETPTDCAPVWERSAAPRIFL
jgi:hypothetical protein